MRASESFDKSKRHLMWFSSALLILTLSIECSGPTSRGIDIIETPSIGIPINKYILLSALWFATLYASFEFYFERRKFRVENNEFFAGSGKSFEDLTSQLIDILRRGIQILEMNETRQIRLSLDQYDNAFNDYTMRLSKYRGSINSALQRQAIPDARHIGQHNFDLLTRHFDTVAAEIDGLTSNFDRIGSEVKLQIEQGYERIENIERRLGEIAQLKTVFVDLEKRIKNIYTDNSWHNVTQWHLVESSLPIAIAFIALVSPLTLFASGALFVCLVASG
jgi:hypothetical protein